MKPFTNKNSKVHYPTVVLTVRVMEPILDLIDEKVGQEDFPNRSAVVQHALAVWAMGEERSNGHQ